MKNISLWYAFNFFIAPLKDGLNPFVSVYLVAFTDISAGTAGLIWGVKELSMILSQVPIGALVDCTTHKKGAMIAFTLSCTLLPLLILFTQDAKLLIVKAVAEGMATSGLMIFKGPFTLGIAGHDDFEAAAKYTEISDHSGSLIVSLLAGIVAYMLYPNVSPLFYTIGIFGALAVISLLLMVPASSRLGDRTNHSVIDDDLARNSIHSLGTSLSNHGTELSLDGTSRSQKQHVDYIPRNGKVESAKMEEAKDTTSTAVENHNGDDNGDCELGKMEHTPTLLQTQVDSALPEEPETSAQDETIPLCQILFGEEKGILFFTIGIFLFHFSNAAILPLVSQVVTLEGGRNGIPYTAANIAIAQFFSLVGVEMMERFTKTGYSINIPIMIGFGTILPRIGMILILLSYWSNPYALIATQIFDGLGNGVNGLAIMKVTKVLTEGTNRFGIVFSIIHLGWGFGSSLSNLISGYVVDLAGYRAAFVFVLFPPSVLSILFIHITNIRRPSYIEGSVEDEDEESDSISATTFPVSQVEEATRETGE